MHLVHKCYRQCKDISQTWAIMQADTASKVADVGNATTETAKKIERSLAGFDKITKLSAPSTDSGSSSGGSGVISDGGLGA